MYMQLWIIILNCNYGKSNDLKPDCGSGYQFEENGSYL